MKTPMEIFKKHGAHYYENDEQAIIDAMTEYAEQQVKNLNIPDVSNRSELLFAFIKAIKEEFADQNWDYLDFMAERFLGKQ